MQTIEKKFEGPDPFIRKCAIEFLEAARADSDYKRAPYFALSAFAIELFIKSLWVRQTAVFNSSHPFENISHDKKPAWGHNLE